MKKVADELQNVIESATARFRCISDSEAAKPSQPGKWSKKQEIGHLMDSAVNNHMRFVRLQISERLELPGYQQQEWVQVHHYQERPWTELVETWRTYNLDLVWIIRHADEKCLKNSWTAPDGKDLTLEYIMSDYVVQLRHHVDHLLLDRT